MLKNINSFNATPIKGCLFKHHALNREPFINTVIIERINMLQFEPYEPITRAGIVPYADQLSQINDVLGDYVLTPDPQPDTIKTAEAEWASYEQANPVDVSTADLTKNAISNLEAIPFRTLLESMDMPFEDQVIYTASDITASTDTSELLANTMANVYQLGNLSQSIFIAMDYLQKLSQQDMDQFSDATQTFITDLTTSTEPFEMITFPASEYGEALMLLDTVYANQAPLMASIVLHPITKYTTLLFINATNIAGMSTKQISDRLNKLSQIKNAINITKVSDIVTSPQVDRNIDESHGMSRASDEISRGERVRNAKIKKLNSTKKVVALIQKDIKKRNTPQRTNNVTKKIKKTYNKPNRREPENDFKPGKTKRNIYRPNIHLYLDTSGSMSLDEYKIGIMASIQIAKDLGSDIYLSSFSDTLAQPILLDKIKSQSTSAIMRRALKVPVLSGGTDFENVYNAIDARATLAAQKGHSPEYSIILSDMEFWFSSGYMVPKKARTTLHLMVSDYDDGADFKTSAYNAGITHIDKLLYKI